MPVVDSSQDRRPALPTGQTETRKLPLLVVRDHAGRSIVQLRQKRLPNGRVALSRSSNPMIPEFVMLSAAKHPARCRSGLRRGPTGFFTPFSTEPKATSAMTIQVGGHALIKGRRLLGAGQAGGDLEIGRFADVTRVHPHAAPRFRPAVKCRSRRRISAVAGIAATAACGGIR
jgi:hypothetical protein